MTGAARDAGLFVPSIAGREHYHFPRRRALTPFAGLRAFGAARGRLFNEFPQTPGARSARLATRLWRGARSRAPGCWAARFRSWSDSSSAAGCRTPRACVTSRLSHLSHLIPLNPAKKCWFLSHPAAHEALRGRATAVTVPCAVARWGRLSRSARRRVRRVQSEWASIRSVTDRMVRSLAYSGRGVKRRGRGVGARLPAGPGFRRRLSGFRCGIVTVSSAYSPGADCGAMVPPWARTMSWERLMPSPVP